MPRIPLIRLGSLAKLIRSLPPGDGAYGAYRKEKKAQATQQQGEMGSGTVPLMREAEIVIHHNTTCRTQGF